MNEYAMKVNLGVANQYAENKGRNFDCEFSLLIYEEQIHEFLVISVYISNTVLPLL